LWALFRELSYFWPGNRYYIEIAADGISCISPLRLRKFAWAELSSFERLSPSKERVWWRSPGRWWPQLHIVAKSTHQRRLCIRGQDFSAFLGGSRVERVEVLVNFLNALLRRAQQGSTAHTAVEAPRGLVVASVGRGIRR
jgi:hypothetical protein